MTDWLTPDEAAAYLKVTRSTIYRWSEEGRLRFHELESGGGRRYHVGDLNRLLQRGDDARARHLRLAAALMRIHDELDAMSLDLEHAKQDFAQGWEGLVKEPAHWDAVKTQAFLQAEAHRDVAPMLPGSTGLTAAALLFNAAVDLARRNGHRVEGHMLSANDGHAKCQLCGGELTVGHPLQGGQVRVIVNSLASQCLKADEALRQHIAQTSRGSSRLADDQAHIPAVFVPPAQVSSPPPGFQLPETPLARIRRSQQAPHQEVLEAQRRAKKRR